MSAATELSISAKRVTAELPPSSCSTSSATTNVFVRPRAKRLPFSSHTTRVCLTSSRGSGPLQVCAGGMTRPRIFVASAGESLDVAYASSQIGKVTLTVGDTDCTVWAQAVMRLSRATTQNLMRQLNNSDFGIFVFNPHYVVLSRSGERAVARDNVVQAEPDVNRVFGSL